MAVRAQVTELTRLVRELSARQSDKATSVGELLAGTVNRIKQLQSEIHVAYSLAHANVDLGRTREAQGLSMAVRAQVTELPRLVRELSARPSDKATSVGELLAGIARQREIVLWLMLIATVAIGAIVGVYTL